MIERNFAPAVIALFLVGLLCAGFLNRAVDPFAFNASPWLRVQNESLAEIKHDRLTRLAKFTHSPKPIIVLGDSRGQNLREEYFASERVDLANLGFGGGTLFEAIDAFWYATRTTRLTNVILVLSFNIWSENTNLNRVTEAITILSSPTRYHLSYFVTATSLSSLWHAIADTSAISSAPPMSKDEFWRYQLKAVEGFYGRWAEPRTLKAKFNAMVEYCRRNNIALTIVIPPTHVDLQKRIDDFRLRGTYSAFLSQMKSAANVIDFETNVGLVSNRDNFDDPFHASRPTMKGVASEIVKQLRAWNSLPVEESFARGP